MINSAHQLASATEMIVLGTAAAQHTSYPRRAERIRRVRAIGFPLTFRDDVPVFGQVSCGPIRRPPVSRQSCSHWQMDAAMVTGVRRVSAQVVWVAKDDGSDIIRADTIAGVGRDYNGNITARLAGGEGSAVTLVAPGTPDGPHTPDDFHRQLIKLVAELSHTAEATIVRPVCDERHGWRWVNEPL